MTPFDESNILDHLERAGLPVDREVARVEAAGEGNINFVRRAWIARDLSVIVKHARPTLERFPEYKAPTDRLRFEARYLRTVDELAGAGHAPTPRVIHFDPDLPCLVLEDLGPGPDLYEALLAGPAPLDALRGLAQFLARIHVESGPHAAALAPRFANAEMQALHGEHIFTLPYRPDAFPVAVETRAAADALLGDPRLRRGIEALRERYYGAREALVHGDVQSTNLLLRGGKLRLLDAEIAHVGDPAFDLGTALAHVHVHLALSPQRDDLREAISALTEGYAEAGGTAEVIDRAGGYAGVEIMRRTIGAARFPGSPSPTAANRVLYRGAALVLQASPH